MTLNDPKMMASCPQRDQIRHVIIEHALSNSHYLLGNIHLHIVERDTPAPVTFHSLLLIVIVTLRIIIAAQRVKQHQDEQLLLQTPINRWRNRRMGIIACGSHIVIVNFQHDKTLYCSLSLLCLLRAMFRATSMQVKSQSAALFSRNAN